MNKENDDQEVSLSGVAIDMASMHCRYFWHQDRVRNGWGIRTWLLSVAEEALVRGRRLPNGKILWAGMSFKFSGLELVAVRPEKKPRALDSVNQNVHNPGPAKKGPALEGPVGANHP